MEVFQLKSTIHRVKENIKQGVWKMYDSIAQNPGFITDEFTIFIKKKFNENMHCTMKF